MKLRTLNRHAFQGVKNLGRNGWMTFASISSVTVALLLVGYFLALMLNLNFLAEQIKDDVEVRAYIDRTATQEQVDQLKSEIQSIPNVEEVTFLPKEDALKDLIDSMSQDGEQASVIASLKDENPLPDAFVIQAERPEQLIGISKEVKPLKHVGEVRYGKGTVESLFEVTDIARNVGVALIIGLLFTAVFLIANTIKLTIVSRRTEIEIMKLVGATNGFIRWPFFVEGLLLGVLGSIIPITLLIIGYQYTYEAFYSNFSTFFIDMIPPNPGIYYLSAGLLAIGGMIGVWGSVTSVRKFLKV